MRLVHRLVFGLAWASCIATSAQALTQPVATGPDGIVAPAAIQPVRIASADRQRELQDAPAWRQFTARHGAWRASWNENTGTPHRAFGPAIRLMSAANDAGAVESAVREFVTDNPGVFGTPTLQTAAVLHANHTWYVRFRQIMGGVPVLFADWEFRVGDNGNLMMFGADGHAPAVVPQATPTLVRAVAREVAHQGIEFRAGIDRVEDRGTWILPYAKAAGTEYRLVYEEQVITQDPPGNWVTLVDAQSGEVLWRFDRVRYAISGHVTGMFHPILPTDALVQASLPSLTVNVGASSVTTDVLGNYSSPAVGTVSITAALRGLFSQVNNDIPPNGSFSTSAADPATVDIAWAAGNSVDTERDVYYHVNLVHDFMKTVDAAFVGNDYSMPCRVNINATCNAFWDGTGVNFYRAGGSCPNTGTMPDVIYHEYGHGINDNLYIQAGSAFGMFNGALHEGMADVIAALIQDNPDGGKGFFGPGTILRSANNTRRWPDNASGDPHITGLIISGAFWDLREAIGLPLTIDLQHFAKYGTPDDPADDGVAMNEYFLETLVADDDDANLANGTPHFTAIVDAFNAHGIGTSFFIEFTHTPLADQAGSSDYPVSAIIQYTGPVGALTVGSTTLHYAINGGAFTSSPMTPTGNPDEFGGDIPGQLAGIIDYYFSASDIYGASNTSPAVAPTRGVYTFLAGPASTVFQQTMETDPGWTVGATGDAATTGVWTRVNPNGTNSSGIPCAPEDDHTPDPGVLCWVTGNGVTGESIGANDVDGGKTTLTSTTFTALGGNYPVIEYYRWFSNDLGSNPATDYWRTLISNDNGTTWVPVENTLASLNDWRRILFFIHDYVTPSATMKLRFVAQDSAAGSVVEAGVDDVRLLLYPGTLAAGDEDRASALSFAPASPNPSAFRTTLRFTLPTTGRVTLRAFDLSGRAVRTLIDSDRQAGPQAIEWNGRDDAGRRLPSGPYFVKVAHGGRELTQKVVLVK